MLGQCLGVSHRVVSALCYCILSEKVILYLEPQARTLLLKNQEILMFKIVSAIIMALWKIYLEVNTLVIVWMDITPSLLMIKGILIRVTPMRMDIKDLHIPMR